MSIKDFFESENFKRFQEDMNKAKDQYDSDAESFWENLSYDDKLKAFYAVTKRIHKGDVQDKGSYRYVLYDVFDFDMDSYGVGMDSGYLDIHNSIYTDDRIVDILRRILTKNQLDTSGIDWDNWKKYMW